MTRRLVRDAPAFVAEAAFAVTKDRKQPVAMGDAYQQKIILQALFVPRSQEPNHHAALPR
jgi:hypothetical protein